MLTLLPSQCPLARLPICVTVFSPYKEMVRCEISHSLGMDICDTSYVKKPPPNGMRPFGVSSRAKPY
ncbi:hypothetical protein TIFTF001_055911, partial [Ficus carica]